MNIGLLMVADEEDILERTLEANEHLVDCFYALDGSQGDECRKICTAHRKCVAYTRDSELPEDYPVRPVDGYRQHLYEQAVAEHGHDNLFLLLHGDEVWTCERDDLRAPPRSALVFPLPVYFPRQGEEWDERHPLEQLHWHLEPGWPEVRLFAGAEGVAYERTQHFDVTPRGIGHLQWTDTPIRHYPYRSPQVQAKRAFRHLETGFDPDNYRHVLEGEVYWSDEMIASWQRRSHFRRLVP